MFGVKWMPMKKFAGLLCLMVVWPIRWSVIKRKGKNVLAVLIDAFFRGMEMGGFLGFEVLVKLCLCLLGELHTL